MPWSRSQWRCGKYNRIEQVLAYNERSTANGKASVMQVQVCCILDCILIFLYKPVNFSKFPLGVHSFLHVFRSWSNIFHRTSYTLSPRTGTPPIYITFSRRGCLSGIFSSCKQIWNGFKPCSCRTTSTSYSMAFNQWTMSAMSFVTSLVLQL